MASNVGDPVIGKKGDDDEDEGVVDFGMVVDLVLNVWRPRRGDIKVPPYDLFPRFPRGRERIEEMGGWQVRYGKMRNPGIFGQRCRQDGFRSLLSSCFRGSRRELGGGRVDR